jgi:hypothetical protein
MFSVKQRNLGLLDSRRKLWGRGLKVKETNKFRVNSMRKIGTGRKVKKSKNTQTLPFYVSKQKTK